MHGLNTIKRLNKTEQDFVDHILSTPIKDINLLDVWVKWKAGDEMERPWRTPTPPVLKQGRTITYIFVLFKTFYVLLCSLGFD